VVKRAAGDLLSSACRCLFFDDARHRGALCLSTMRLEKTAKALLHRRLLARRTSAGRGGEGERGGESTRVKGRACLLLFSGGSGEDGLGRQSGRCRERLCRVGAGGGRTSGATATDRWVKSRVEEIGLERRSRERDQREGLDVRWGGSCDPRVGVVDGEGRKRERRRNGGEVAVEKGARVDGGCEGTSDRYLARTLGTSKQVEFEGKVELAEVGCGEGTAKVAHRRLNRRRKRLVAFEVDGGVVGGLLTRKTRLAETNES
jgi:hypothetical protein